MSGMDIQGYWYDGQQSGQQPAVVHIDQHGYMDVFLSDGDSSTLVYARHKLFSGQIADIKISQRLGNTSRYFYFPDGQKFETRDNDQVDHATQQFSSKNNSLIYKLETRWRYVLVAVALMIAVVAWSGLYGVPIAAKAIAKVMPDSLIEKAGEQTLAFLDKEMMQPTTLDHVAQERVRQHFSTIIQEHPDQNIKLHFRSSPEVGPNAFALPDGSIIFTDEMVVLAEHNDELLSVMAHEIGHVVHQHGMRGVIQGSIVGFVLMMMTGDASAATELFLGIPVLLTQLGYSRGFEREADDYALAYMQDKGIDTEHFSRLMSRLQGNHCDSTPVGNESDIEESHCEHDHTGDSWQRYLSTHPGLEERIKKFSDDSRKND